MLVQNPNDGISPVGGEADGSGSGQGSTAQSEGDHYPGKCAGEQESRVGRGKVSRGK